MSLVNEMLRDLEDRQDTSAPRVAHVTTGYNGQQQANPAAKVALGIGAGLMLCAAGFWYWQSSEITTNNTEQVAETTAVPTAKIIEPVAIEPAVIESVIIEKAQPLENSTADTTAATASLPVEPAAGLNSEPEIAAVEDAPSNQLREILAAAELALSKNRLTTPIDDNAFDHYQAALKIKPDHPEALFGLQQIRRRYQHWAVDAFQRGDTAQALAQLERALLVSPGNSDLLHLQQQFQNAAAPTTKPTVPAVNLKTQPVVNTALNMAAEQATVSTSSETLDHQAVAAANQLLDSGRVARATNLLSSHIASNPAARHSTQRLAELYLQAGNEEALQKLLTNSPALSNAEATAYQARFKLQQQDLQGALSLLEQQPPSVIDSPDYHSLLAGIYHKSGKHAQAATIYQKLVAIEPNSYRHWLGLAVAMDALKEPRAALQAFKRARIGSGNNAQISNYIDRRIAALSSG